MHDRYFDYSGSKFVFEAIGKSVSARPTETMVPGGVVKFSDGGIFRSMSDSQARQTAEDHYYAALDLFATGQAEAAVAEYEKSIATDPTFTEAMHGLARALQDLNRLDEAIAVAGRIAEIDPDDVLAHTSLSVLYQKKGMIPEAEAEGNKARILGWKQQLKKGGG